MSTTDSKYTFLPDSRLIVLSAGVTSITMIECYSAWKRWAVLNSQYLPAFRTLGGDIVSDTISVSNYYFMMNGWRIRPQETNHTLLVDGNVSVDGGGDPIVPTLGNYNVMVRMTVPVKAETLRSTAADAAAVWAFIQANGISAENNLLGAKSAAENAFAVSA
jgi:hypothetical protein